MSLAVAYKVKRKKHQLKAQMENQNRAMTDEGVANFRKERSLGNFREREGAGREMTGWNPKKEHEWKLAEIKDAKGPHGNYAKGGKIVASTLSKDEMGKGLGKYFYSAGPMELRQHPEGHHEVHHPDGKKVEGMRVYEKGGRFQARWHDVDNTSKKKAHGGQLTDDGYQSECTEHCDYPCMAHGGPVEMGKKGGEPHVLHETKRMHGGFPDRMGPTGPTGYSNRNKSSDLGGGQRKGPEGYPKYQEQAQNQKGVHTPVSGVTGFPGGKGTSRAGSYTKERYGDKPLFSGKGHPAIKEHKKVLKEMRKDKGDRRNLAKGGVVDRIMMARGGNVHDTIDLPGHSGESHAGKRLRDANKYGSDMASSKAVAMGDSKFLHRQILANIRADKRDRKYMAEGGRLVHHSLANPKFKGQSSAGIDVRWGNKYPHMREVASEMAKEKHQARLYDIRADKHDRRNMSEGGQIANEDEMTAGFEPNEFDYLEDNDTLESSYTGANSGDELGNAQEDEDRHDIVSRIMRAKRMRAGHNPRPA